jgi:hypothetical protein
VPPGILAFVVNFKMIMSVMFNGADPIASALYLRNFLRPSFFDPKNS